MIKKKLKTTTGYLVVNIPDKLSEITIGQMMELQEKMDLNDIEAISILSGIAVEELKNVSNVADIQVFENVVLSLSHQITHVYNSDAIPASIIFTAGKNNVKIKVLRNLSVEPVGAFMAARDIITDEINSQKAKHGADNFDEYFNPSLKACCNVLAQFFYCNVTGKKYNEYDAEEFCAEIKKLTVTEALPIAHANEVEKFLWDNKADFPLWRYNQKNKSARQAGPRIRGIDKNRFNYPTGFNQLSVDDILPVNEFMS